MKILLVSTETTGGGIATHGATLAEQLANCGHRVLTFVPDRQAPRKSRSPVLAFPRAGRHEVVELAAPVFPVARRGFSLLGAALPYALAIRDALFRLTERPDVIEAPDWEAPSLLVDRRIPTVVRLHGSLSMIRRLDDDPMRLQDRLIAGLEAHAARSATLCLASSAYLSLAASCDLQLAPGRVGVAPLGIDTDAFSPGSRDLARDAWSLPRSAKVVLFVGRLERRKGFADLLAAWKGIARTELDAFLIVAGDGTERHRVGPGDPKVSLLGPVPHDRLPSLYQAADVVCLPAPAEPFGLTTLEAMACGRPVIGCRGGATPEIVLDDTGRLVAPGDLEALQSAIAGLLGQPALCRKLGLAGRARVEAYFSADRAARRTLAAYEAARRAVLVGGPPAVWIPESDPRFGRTAV